MSLVDSSHIVGARQRHGAHYMLKRVRGTNELRPGMDLYRDTVSNPVKSGEPICSNCFRAPFDPEAKKCVRCGGEIG